MKNNNLIFISVLLIVLQNNIIGQVQIGQDIYNAVLNYGTGKSLSISDEGNRIAFKSDEGGSQGRVKVFELLDNNWIQIGQDIDGEYSNDNSGRALDISGNGNRIAISSTQNSDNGGSAGHVRVYEFNGNSWIQLGNDVNGEQAGYFLGVSVEISFDGDRFIVGGDGYNGNGGFTGHARVFEFNGSDWMQIGANIVGEAAYDAAGETVSISSDGNTIAVGAPGSDGGISNGGSVRIFRLVDNSWIQRGNNIYGQGFDDFSGSAISLSGDGNRIIIGAPESYHIDGRRGKVQVFEFNNNQWIQLGSDIYGDSSEDLGGNSVSITKNGLKIAIGYPGAGEDNNYKGYTRILEYLNNDWTQVGLDIEGGVDSDKLGTNISLSGNGNFLIVNSKKNDITNNNDGHIQVFGDLSTPIVESSPQQFHPPQVYPSLTSSHININSNENYFDNIYILNISGNLISQFKYPITKIDVNHLQSGTYFIVFSNSTKTITKSFIKL